MQFLILKNNIKYFIFLLGLMQIFSCTSYEKIKTGAVAMERKQYAVAQQLLQNEITEVRGFEKGYCGSEKTQEASSIGICYVKESRCGNYGECKCYCI